MKYQNHPSSCGAAALVNAIRLMGSDSTEEGVQEAAGTGWDGTSPKGLRKAAKALGYKMVEVNSVSVLYGPAVLLVDDGDHWVACARLAVGNYVVVDSAAGVGQHQRELVGVVTPADLHKRATCGGKVYGLVLEAK